MNRLQDSVLQGSSSSSLHPLGRLGPLAGGVSGLEMVGLEGGQTVKALGGSLGETGLGSMGTVAALGDSSQGPGTWVGHCSAVPVSRAGPTLPTTPTWCNK